MKILAMLIWFAGIFVPEAQDLQADSTRLSQTLDNSRDIIYDYPDSASRIAMDVLAEAQELKLLDISARALSRMAFVANLKGNYSDALHHDIMALEMATGYGQDSVLLYSIYNNIGDHHIEVRNFDKAHENFVTAYGIAESINDTLGMAISTFNIGLVLKELEQFDGAMDNFERSIELSEAVGDTEGLAFVNSEIGHVFFQQSDFSSADNYYQKALAIVDTLQNIDLKASILERYGMNELHLDRLQSSERRFNESLSLARELENLELQAKVLNGLARLFEYQGKLNQAESLVDQSITLSAGSNKKEIEYESYRILSDIYSDRNDFRNSLRYFEMYHHLKDSVMEEEKKVQISNLQLLYDLEMKDLEITALNNRESLRMEQIEREQNLRNILMVLMAVLMLLLFIVYRSGSRRRKMNKMLTQHRDEVQKQKDELAKLNKVKDKFFSILAHDLRSPIKSLSGVLNLLESNNLSEEETKKLIGTIGRRTEQTQRLLDNLLEWALIQMDKITVNKTEFPLKEVIDKNVELIIETSDKPVNIETCVNGMSVYADQNMVDLVLRNLLSNAIKYSGNEPEIEISADRDDKNINIHVKDNGVGISNEYIDFLLGQSDVFTKSDAPEAKGSGFGLKISKEFIERNGGSLWIDSTPGEGSTFSFSIPVSETKA